jgi:hypothetical protein
MATDPPYKVVNPPPPPRPAQVIALITVALAAILAFLGYGNPAGISATISLGASLYDLVQTRNLSGAAPSRTIAGQ